MKLKDLPPQQHVLREDIDVMVESCRRKVRAKGTSAIFSRMPHKCGTRTAISYRKKLWVGRVQYPATVAPTGQRDINECYVALQSTRAGFHVL